jgi:uncharacterized RDD family membrane protein YckC
VSEANWYYAKDGVQTGPVPLATMRDMVRMGTLFAHDLVWSEGMPEWRTAASVQAVYGLAPGATLAYAGGRAPAYPGALEYYNPAAEFSYAGFWLRFLAIFLDGLIIGVPLAAVAALVVFGLGLHKEFNNPNSTVPAVLDLAFRLIYVLVAWLYSASQESGPHMATWGKRACGIVVTDVNGHRLTFGRASGRFFAKILSNITCYIGYVMAAFTERRQGLHDMVAGTVVVHK